MKKLTILAVALIGSCAAASATTVAPTFVGNLGNDPIASVTNDIIKRDVTSNFTDAYLFTLTPPGTFAVTGSATENYSTADRLINPFTVSFWSVGTDGFAGTADDFQLIGQTGGSAPGAVPGSAQSSSSGFIDSPNLLSGNNAFYFQVSGTATQSGGAYAGEVDTHAVPVPGPIVGAGLPGLIAACGAMLALARRRRRHVA